MEQIEPCPRIVGSLQDGKVVRFDVFVELLLRVPTPLASVGSEEDARSTSFDARPHEPFETIGHGSQAFAHFLRIRLEMFRRFPTAHTIPILKGIEYRRNNRDLVSHCLDYLPQSLQLVLEALRRQRSLLHLCPVGRT